MKNVTIDKGLLTNQQLPRRPLPRGQTYNITRDRELTTNVPVVTKTAVTKKPNLQCKTTQGTRLGIIPKTKKTLQIPNETNNE